MLEYGLQGGVRLVDTKNMQWSECLQVLEGFGGSVFAIPAARVCNEDRAQEFRGAVGRRLSQGRGVFPLP